MAVLGFLCGGLFGVALGIFLLSVWVKNSNDFGNSEGTLKDFSNFSSVQIMEKRNNINFHGHGNIFDGLF